jgi:hypothetical protein
VFGLLPYILVGMKTHIDGSFQEGSNRAEDIAAFLVNLLNLSDVQIESYLCAHRGHSAGGLHVLLTSTHEVKIRKAINLQLGILANVQNLKHRKILWYQQGPTAKASSNMFPEMFLEYLHSGKIPDMLSLLEEHFKEVDLLLVDSSTDTGIDAHLCNLDVHTAHVYRYLGENYGTDWRLNDYGSIDVSRKDVLAEIALDSTLPEVRRFMPFFDKPNKLKVEGRQELMSKNMARARMLDSGNQENLARRTASAIDWFFYDQTMHISAKALYETVFFYLWGFETATHKERCPIGVSRDHAEFQHDAWALGYLDACKNELDGLVSANSVLYMRRTTKEKIGGALKDTSFRQFWR